MGAAGVLVSTVFASLLTVINYVSGSGGVFEILVLITTFSATVPYLLATAAQVYFLLTGRGDKVRTGSFVRDMVLAVGGFAFSFWLVAGAGYAAIYQGVLFLFAGILVYVWMAARRSTQEGAEQRDASGSTAQAETPPSTTTSAPTVEPASSDAR